MEIQNPSNVERPEKIQQKDNVDQKLAAQLWHSFRQAEYNNWKNCKEGQGIHSVLQHFKVDNTSLMQDIGVVQQLGDKGLS